MPGQRTRALVELLDRRVERASREPVARCAAQTRDGGARPRPRARRRSRRPRRSRRAPPGRAPRGSPPGSPRARRGARRTRTRARGRTSAPRSRSRRRGRGLRAPSRGSEAVERPVPTRTDIARPTIPRGIPAVASCGAWRRPRSSRSSGRRGSARRRSRVALAERLRAQGEDPVAVSADALQVYAGLEILTGAASAAERARLEHRLVGFLPVTETFSAGAVRGARPRRDRRAAGRGAAADRRRRHRACTCAPRSRSSTCARPGARAPRGAAAATRSRRGARPARASSPRARPAAAQAIEPDRRAARRPRARAARRGARAAARRGPPRGCGPPSCATRPCWRG